MAWSLRNALPKDTELIDSHFGFPEGVAAHKLGRRLGLPFTITLRGNETMHSQDAAKREQMADAFRNAAAVIGVSRSLRDFAVELGAAPERAHVIPNGIDGAIFYPRDRNAARQRFNFREGPKHIVSVGYLIERKGHHRVMDALQKLWAEGIDAELWIVGDPGREGSFGDELQRRASSMDAKQRIHIVPGVPPDVLAEYMSAADLLCLASSREGWPNVLMEAQACGTPVVSTDVGGAQDMVDAGSGFVVPPDDPAALRSEIARALNQEWDRSAIALRGASRTWRQVAAEVFSVFQQVLSNR